MPTQLSHDFLIGIVLLLIFGTTAIFLVVFAYEVHAYRKQSKIDAQVWLTQLGFFLFLLIPCKFHQWL